MVDGPLTWCQVTDVVRSRDRSFANNGSQEATQTQAGTVVTNEPVVESAPIDEAALIEERRRKREAIKAKYKGQAAPLLVQALQHGSESGPVTPKVETPESVAENSGQNPQLVSLAELTIHLSVTRDVAYDSAACFYAWLTGSF